MLQLGHADKVTGLVSTVDGVTTFTASEDSTIRVWSGREKSLLRVLTGHSVGVTALALSRDDRWLVSGCGRGTVLVHDLKRDFEPKGPQDHRIRSEWPRSPSYPTASILYRWIVTATVSSGTPERTFAGANSFAGGKHLPRSGLRRQA